MELISIIVLLLSGTIAGIMTGIISASAVTFMAGILMVFLNFSAYNAIGLSLITDVFASFTSAIIYKKSSNINIRGGLLIALFATIFAFIGSYISLLIPDIALGDGLGIVTLITGMIFIKNPMKRNDQWFFNYFKKNKITSSVIIGVFVGLFCGFFGVGGGVTLLILLIFFLDYPIKRAVGTSVLIMAFIALSGGIAHYINSPIPIMTIIIASIGGIFGAIISSKYANKISEEKMFRISGIILILISFVVIFKKFFFAPFLQILGF